MSRVLITGASGFVGACLLRACLRQGDEVFLLLRANSRNWRIQSLLHHPQVHVYTDDLSDLAVLTEKMQQISPEVIYHLAAHGAYSFEKDATAIISTNALGTWNLLAATQDIPYQLFVNTGSSSEYGTQTIAMQEDMLVHPNSVYAVTKVAATQLSQFSAQEWSKPIVTARLFSVYGSWEDPRRLLPTLMHSLYKDQEIKLAAPDTARDYIAVADVIDFYLQRTELAQHPGAVFNVGTGKQTTLRDLVSQAEKITGRLVKAEWSNYPARQWDTNHWVADMSHTHQSLPWRAKRTLPEGLKEMWQWWQQEAAVLPEYNRYESKATAPAVTKASNHSRPFWITPSLTAEQIKWRRWILDYSHQHSLSHLGSCLSTCDILGAIYAIKKADEPIVLSNGHAGIALYCQLVQHGLVEQQTLESMSIHPDRNPDYHIDVSTGSLGQGWPIALGLAKANPDRKVYAVISDGEASEGSIWETARIVHDWQVKNLITVINVNGYGAYDPIDTDKLLDRFTGFGWQVIRVNGHDLSSLLACLQLAPHAATPTLIAALTTVEQLPSLQGQDAHYHVLTAEEYQEAIKIWN